MSMSKPWIQVQWTLAFGGWFEGWLKLGWRANSSWSWSRGWQGWRRQQGQSSYSTLAEKPPWRFGQAGETPPWPSTAPTTTTWWGWTAARPSAYLRLPTWKRRWRRRWTSRWTWSSPLTLPCSNFSAQISPDRWKMTDENAFAKFLLNSCTRPDDSLPRAGGGEAALVRHRVQQGAHWEVNLESKV